MFAYKRFAIVAIALATVLVSCWLLLSYRLPGNTHFWQSLQNAGHAILFFAIAFVFSALLAATRYKNKPFHIAFVVLVASLVFGGLVELIQGFIGREPSWSDMWLDAQGAIAGICVYLALFTRRVSRIVATVLAAALLFNSLSLPIRWLIAEHQRGQCFPVIADFENRWLSMFVDGRSKAKAKIVPTPTIWANNKSGRVLSVEFGRGRWPSVVFYELEPDWSAYNNFVFEAYNPQATPVTLSLRITDKSYSRKYSDRFNAQLELVPGYNEIKIPLARISQLKSGREMDLSQVDELIVFTGKQTPPVTLYLDHFRLE
ncbi:VanZ family protein [Saccharophagus degradans]|uniref:VanZ family protein n=1 Tax=Saccharophagus degradans TaxID=86304 RepID=A0AAW7X3X7_9GAMM|nr:VanZ family protein [Saccharophagus degradans]MDO6421114.1 VanZ family protein [Saccharophagus degradans]MDO6605975.1 VanZ family protein [Saccharophagus degradans]